MVMAMVMTTATTTMRGGGERVCVCGERDTKYLGFRMENGVWWKRIRGRRSMGKERENGREEGGLGTPKSRRPRREKESCV